MKLRKKAKSGFSLIEVIISVMILVVVLIPVTDMLVVSTKTQAKAKQKQEATEIGQSKLEELCANSSISITGNSYTDLDGHVFGMTENPTTHVWTGTNSSNFGKYTVEFTLTKGKATGVATSTVINYQNNQKEVDEIKDENYSNVLTFQNAEIGYYDESGNKQYQGITNNCGTLYIDIDGDNTNGIENIYIKDSSSKPILSIKIDSSKQKCNKIKIIQGEGFQNADDLPINLASKINGVPPTEVDFIRMKNTANCTKEIKLNNYADAEYQASTSIIQGISQNAIAVSDDLYTIGMEVKDSKDNTIFKGQETKNLKLNIN